MEFATEYNRKGAVRFNISNPPAAGTELITASGEEVVFDEVSFAGMLACTRKSDGSQQLYWPHDLAASISNNEASGAAAGDKPAPLVAP